MVRWDEEAAGTELGLRRTLIVVAIVWAMHAIANLVSPKQRGRGTWLTRVEDQYVAGLIIVCWPMHSYQWRWSMIGVVVR